MKTLVYAFISSQTDYCNSVFTGISGQLIQRLQAIQNAADCLITGAGQISTYDTDTASTALATIMARDAPIRQ